MVANKSTIAVLLATYSGAAFLEEQLSSIACQDWNSIDLWASDDGSTDGTLDILRSWQAKWSKGDFHIVDGPRKGYVENFRRLMSTHAIDGAYVAFSDQDDIWDTNKLTRAVKELGDINHSSSAMYCSRTRLISNDGLLIGMSPLFSCKPSFRNAIVQSIGGGNTIVLNSKAFAKLQESCHRTSFVSHDWWCYQIVSGSGGVVFYDPVPTISYRQHGSNLIGENRGWPAQLKRLKALGSGRFAAWNAINIEALGRCRDLLDDDGRAILDGFKEARGNGPLRRVGSLWRHRIHRQTIASNVALYLAAIAGKL